MALQVWLPLNGDLHNQGLYQSINITTSNTAPTINNEGKISKCYQFNTNYLQGEYQSNTNEVSFCVWLKFDTLSNCHIIDGRAKSGEKGYQPIYYNTSSGIQVGSSSSAFPYISNTFVVNTWYHVAVVYKSTKTTLYINGQYKGEASTSKGNNFNQKLNFTLGGRCSSTSSAVNPFKGCLNDFRIYNHALTEKEIQKISQGLVLHYQLNKSNINLLNAVTKSANTTTYNAYQFNLKENLIANQTYIMQLWNVNVSHSGKTANELGLSVYWGGGYVQLKTLNGTQYFTNGHADYLKFSFTPTSANASHANAANAWLNIYNSVPSKTGTMSMSIETWKLEKDNGTSREEPDDSGNNFNGIVIDNTTANRQSPKYGNAIKFNTTSGKIKLPIIPFSNFGNNYTFAWWQYNTGSSNMAWGFKDGNRLNVYQTTTMNLNTGDGNTNQYKTSGGGTLSINTYKNAWHHFCITGDGTTSKLYINGNYIASAITYRSLTGTQIYISGWDAGTSYTFNGSNICDFRIYSTVLSAAAVKELYLTSLDTSSGSPKARGLE